MLVVDASALGEYLLGESAARAVGAVVMEHDAELHTAALCDVEVAAILRRALRSGALTLERAADAIIDFVDLPLTRHEHTALLGRIVQLRENFTAYDATYVALAERLDAVLLTTDSPLARAIEAHGSIEVMDASIYR